MLWASEVGPQKRLCALDAARGFVLWALAHARVPPCMPYFLPAHACTPPHMFCPSPGTQALQDEIAARGLQDLPPHAIVRLLQALVSIQQARAAATAAAAAVGATSSSSSGGRRASSAKGPAEVPQAQAALPAFRGGLLAAAFRCAALCPGWACTCAHVLCMYVHGCVRMRAGMRPCVQVLAVVEF